MATSRFTQMLGKCVVVLRHRLNKAAEAHHVAELRSRLKSIGSHVELAPGIDVDYAGRISIGNWVYIGPGCLLSGRGSLAIADHVVMGPQVTIMTSMHNHHDAKYIPYDEIELLKPVSIGVGCWIGMKALLLPGANLGDGCIVGAAAVVTKSFPEGSIVAGNPARLIGQRDMVSFRDYLGKDRTYLKHWYFKGKEKVEQMSDD